MCEQYLRPCPFCGEKYINLLRIEESDECWLECSSCGIETQLYDNEELAVAAWNKRAAELNSDEQD